MITIEEIISQVESSGNVLAIRFEPTVYAGLSFPGLPKAIVDCLTVISQANACDMETAKVIYSTSWGEYQFMGETLYSDPVLYSGSIIAFSNNPVLQGQYFQTLIQRKSVPVPDLNPPVGHEPDMQEFLKFAVLYNGPGDPSAYAQRMMDVWRELRKGEI